MATSGKNNYWILALITAVAVFVRLYGLNWGPGLPLEQKASIILSVSAGILSVIGLYFLVKELFDENLAMISSFLLAVSSWHIFMSKSGAKETLASFALIYAFYFIWHGLKYGHVFDFFMAGLFGGAGLYAGKSFLVAPLAVLLLFLNYWDYIKKDFSLSKYSETKGQILGGFSLLVLTAMAVVLPVGFYVWQNPGFILSADNSVFSSAEPFTQLYRNLGWLIDKIVFIEPSGSNLVSWPISIFFAIGFIKEIIHWLKRKHGHFSVAHTVVFSWLFVMLVPVLLPADPSAQAGVLGLSVILPPIILLSAKGLWWVMEKLNKWEHLVYPHTHSMSVGVYPHQHKHWMGLNAGPFLALIALMVSIALLEVF
ncbi:MAG: hypothetical protein A2651_00265 [Candidatus Yanofskybacteria bacterium RIFCSPHIGHO2_01_FULL_42_12]|uniref:Glycosyltransferase RgtA/B/C/D-like domain-containing protein n=1 Tax=Candidatus Yanofskybacteria bacterium RIFCSPLOWO2_01_FULL_42_49 TaxID=1802694 RepID=A0A1F8GA96_9BACT|nr:MAG: hypothetical protein A2651_00265 [Candidatus Yanofskybacteria bacterium RIFCSPHIGHO2_01_FULL_42_12]OGN22295.1 MAG: hypothetical protein A2918_00020 [Candidatus Yanofskybacteria bacterium RIFCSPLOWO2_01_FULL_42_49]